MRLGGIRPATAIERCESRWWGNINCGNPAMTDRCEHFSAIRNAEPRTAGCEECQAIKAVWNELRVCLTCGHVGCCEDSEHAHALAHFNSTGHPMISAVDRGETWGWCYIHRRYFDPMPGRSKKRSALGSLVGHLFGRRGKRP
jgi:hypothetical protein